MQFSHKDISVLHHCKHKEQTEHLHFKNSSDYDPPMNVGFINVALPVKEVLVSGDRGRKMRWNHVTRNLWMPRENERLSGKPWKSFTYKESQIVFGFSTTLTFLRLLFLSCCFFGRNILGQKIPSEVSVWLRAAVWTVRVWDEHKAVNSDVATMFLQAEPVVGGWFVLFL